MSFNAVAAGQPKPAALSIDHAARAAGVSRRTLYRELASGRLKAVKLGRRTLIPSDSFAAWLAGLPAAGIGEGAR
jgi:excisionase family DNA binding protein